MTTSEIDAIIIDITEIRMPPLKKAERFASNSLPENAVLWFQMHSVTLHLTFFFS
jgi:hypothetical protein